MSELPKTESAGADGTIIIGAGVAGLYTALKCAPRPVTILSAAPVGVGASSVYAQGGMAAALGEDDDTQNHFYDTLRAGCGMVHNDVAHLLVKEAKSAVEDLAKMGVVFDQGENGTYKLGKEAAHSHNRIVHATGDRAGAEIMAVLTKAAMEAEHITIREGIIVEDLLRTGEGHATGVMAYDVKAQERLFITCPRIVMATGGVGGLFQVTTNPISAQGHGLAIAMRAGAEIVDPEFVQFHPTALDVDRDPAPLATEALRGEGAVLVNKDGMPLMKGFDDRGDLAPRDVVARGVAKSIKAGQGAFLDARMAIGPAFQEKFPTVWASCVDAGINPTKDVMPVAPAAHYHMGGIGTDKFGRTTMPGLYAVGECAATGLHGANRLASNSLTEAFVFGARTATAIKENTDGFAAGGLNIQMDRLDMEPTPATPEKMAALRDVMTQEVGMLRDQEGLFRAQRILSGLAQEEKSSGMNNALIAATLIIQGALDRQESRGAHQRSDFPKPAETPEHNGFRWKDMEGRMIREKIPLNNQA